MKRRLKLFVMGDPIQRVDKGTWKVICEGEVVRISYDSIEVKFSTEDIVTLVLNKTGSINQTLPDHNYFPKY